MDLSNETQTYTQPVVKYVSSVSKYLTDKITEILTNNGFTVSQRWSSTVLLFLSLLIIFLGMRLTKPIFKWGLIVLAIVILGGLIIPW